MCPFEEWESNNGKRSTLRKVRLWVGSLGIEQVNDGLSKLQRSTGVHWSLLDLIRCRYVCGKYGIQPYSRSGPGVQLHSIVHGGGRGFLSLSTSVLEICSEARAN